jgi:hypothetical protein
MNGKAQRPAATAGEGRRGRKKKAQGEVKNNHISLWLDDSQTALVEKAAAADDDKLNNWARRMVLRAAREKLGAAAAATIAQAAAAAANKLG